MSITANTRVPPNHQSFSFIRLTIQLSLPCMKTLKTLTWIVESFLVNILLHYNVLLTFPSRHPGQRLLTTLTPTIHFTVSRSKNVPHFVVSILFLPTDFCNEKYCDHVTLGTCSKFLKSLWNCLCLQRTHGYAQFVFSSVPQQLVKDILLLETVHIN